MIDPSIPLIDLNRHLKGSLRLQTIIDLGRQHHLPLPAWDLEGLRPYVQVTEPRPGVMAFIARFDSIKRVLVDYAVCRRRDCTLQEMRFCGLPGILSLTFNAPGRLACRSLCMLGRWMEPQSIWSAIRELGAVRIGRAVRATEDPTLLDYMLEHAIGIESNLTSNIQTSTVTDYASHPLRTFLNQGLLATINTDDPGIRGIDLPYEYEVAAPAAGLTMTEVSQAQHNSLAIALLSSREIDALRIGRPGGV